MSGKQEKFWKSQGNIGNFVEEKSINPVLKLICVIKVV